jgi:hypothetical protein
MPGSRPLSHESASECAEREFLEGLRYEDKFPDECPDCAYGQQEDCTGMLYRCPTCNGTGRAALREERSDGRLRRETPRGTL